MTTKKSVATTKPKATATKKTTVKTTVKKTTKKAPTKKFLAAKKAAGKAARKAAGSKSGKKNAASLKKAGKGLFAPCTVTPALAKIVGTGKMPRTEIVKKLWAYIKAKKLNKGRIISPDATLKAVIPAASIDMLKMTKLYTAHIKKA